MDSNLFTSLSRISNEELLALVKHFAARERNATAELVGHLAEMDARRLALALGCPSLYKYCTDVLHLSEHAAYGRIEAARAARRFPVVLELLARGDLNLTAVTLLKPVLTEENHRALLGEARHKSRRAIEEIVARVRPRPDVPDSIRKLGPPRAPRALDESPPAGVDDDLNSAGSAARSSDRGSAADARVAGIAEAGAAVSEVPSSGAGESFSDPDRGAAAAKTSDRGSAAPSVARSCIAPLAPERYRVQFTAPKETCEKLRRAQDLLRHAVPDGDLAKIVDRALDALLKEIEKKKFAAADKPREARGRGRGSRSIPAAVRRAVWERDGERCTFVGPDGRRCTSRGFLEFDHEHPYAVGGPATVDNVRVLCAAHNGYAADLYFGPRVDPRVNSSRLPDASAADSVRTEPVASPAPG